MSPLVSIIIPAYNAAHYLPAALQSCFDQTYPHLEIIVVDDGSTDNTRALMQDYPQVKYIYQANKGLPGARNTGIQHCSGIFLQFLDADDLLLPSKIERCLAVFEQSPETGVVYTDYERRSNDLSAVLEIKDRAAVMPEGNVLHAFFNRTATFFGVHCALLRREPVEAIGLFNESLRSVEDWNFWIRLAAAGTLFRHIPEKLVIYRDSPEAITKNELNMALGRLKAAETLRGIPLPPDLDLDGKIAERQHVVALKLWQMGRKREARQHLQAAIRLQAKGRLTRILLTGLSYFLPVERATAIIDRLQNFRPLTT